MIQSGRLCGLQTANPPCFVVFSELHIVTLERFHDSHFHVFDRVTGRAEVFCFRFITGPAVLDVTAVAVDTLMERLSDFSDLLYSAVVALNNVDYVGGYAGGRNLKAKFLARSGAFHS